MSNFCKIELNEIKEYANLKITKDDIFASYEQEIKDWSEINIKKRQKN